MSSLSILNNKVKKISVGYVLTRNQLISLQNGIDKYGWNLRFREDFETFS